MQLPTAIKHHSHPHHHGLTSLQLQPMASSNCLIQTKNLQKRNWKSKEKEKGAQPRTTPCQSARAFSYTHGTAVKFPALPSPRRRRTQATHVAHHINPCKPNRSSLPASPPSAMAAAQSIQFHHTCNYKFQNRTNRKNSKKKRKARVQPPARKLPSPRSHLVAAARVVLIPLPATSSTAVKFPALPSPRRLHPSHPRRHTARAPHSARPQAAPPSIQATPPCPESNPSGPCSRDAATMPMPEYPCRAQPCALPHQNPRRRPSSLIQYSPTSPPICSLVGAVKTTPPSISIAAAGRRNGDAKNEMKQN
ncbi:hypothetical protein M0R45_002325 [Rubus argutus]|uniref:Uncharacterized protein n=1 Tax=Rubus argutus TaxID=59490 RepID=A0AAW1VDA4_RUBAR